MRNQGDGNCLNPYLARSLSKVNREAQRGQFEYIIWTELCGRKKKEKNRAEEEKKMPRAVRALKWSRTPTSLLPILD